jgi:hypothetical protein
MIGLGLALGPIIAAMLMVMEELEQDTDGHGRVRIGL